MLGWWMYRHTKRRWRKQRRQARAQHRRLAAAGAAPGLLWWLLLFLVGWGIGALVSYSALWFWLLVFGSAFLMLLVRR
jgi:hypothetical protein